MGLSPRKNITPKLGSVKASKAPGKSVLPRNKFQQQQQQQHRSAQRRFSLIDSDSSLSDFESDDDDDDDDDNDNNNDDDEPPNRNNFKNSSYGKKEFQAIESSDEDDSDSDTNEEIWRNNSKKVVNTSSEEEEDDDSEDDVSSSDDEDVDFVKLTAERKAKALAFRGDSPFRSPSPTKAAAVAAATQDLDHTKDKHNKNNANSNKDNNSNKDEDVDFSFNFHGNDHLLKIVNEEEEEDVGEDLGEIMSPLGKEIHMDHHTEPLGFMDIEESSESDGDIDKEELLKTLEQDSDGLDDGLETGDDELDMLQKEADMIAQEYDDDGLQLSSANVTPRNSVVEEMIKKHKVDNEEVLQYVSDDEYDSDYDDENDYADDFTIPYFDDSMFKEKLFTEGLRNQQKEKELDSDDDSYLWDYFFSSGDESDHENDAADKNHISSDDEATDEDTTLPPPSSRKKIGSKAQELLSSSSVTARPPALGTWSTDSKPFGIIDGLSTRSLLPTNSARSTSSTTSYPNNTTSNSTTNTKNLPLTPIASNIEELTLDELLNMSELEDDDNEDWAGLTNIESERKVPLSAFRNKGIINEQPSHLNATRRFSISNLSTNPKKHSKNAKHAKFNEITMTPVRSIPKTSKHKKKNGKLKVRRQSMAEAAVEGMRVTRSGLFSEDTLSNVEEFLSGLGNEAELSILFREIE